MNLQDLKKLEEERFQKYKEALDKLQNHQYEDPNERLKLYEQIRNYSSKEFYSFISFRRFWLRHKRINIMKGKI